MRKDVGGSGVKFWVIVPAYNAEQWIRAAVGSVREQMYGNYR